MRIFTGVILLISSSSSSFAIDDLQIQGLFKDTAIVKIDGKRRVLKIGKPSLEGAVLIKANSEKARIEIDGQQQDYFLSKRISNQYKAQSAKNSISIAPNKNGMYIVNGSINGFQVKFLIDTGATNIAMSERHAKRLGLDYKLEGTKGLSSTASGDAVTWMLPLKKVKVGSLQLRDLQANVIKGSHPDMILLGNSFLNQVKMVRHGRMMKLSSK